MKLLKTGSQETRGRAHLKPAEQQCTRASQASVAWTMFWHSWGHMNSQDFLPFTLKTFRVAKLPPSAQQLLPITSPSFLPVTGPGDCREGSASGYPAIRRHWAFPERGSGWKTACLHYSSPLGPPRSLIAMQNHTPCFSPFQLFLHLRKDREIWCATVRRHSFS